jgi:3-oxoacyl-[acyl-carrier protein] reductase
MENRLLERKVCLVTGTGKGIGKIIVEKYAEHGAVVYANARKTGSIDEWTNHLSIENKTKIIPVYFDICDFSSVKDAIIKIKNEQGQLDALVNNAGVVSYENLNMINFENLRQMFEVNVIAMINLIQLGSRMMARKKRGSIINMASIVGLKGAKGQLAYSATKGAVISLTKSAAKELAESNIRVNAIAPGMVGTERFKDIFENKFKERINSVGFGRLAYPLEIADACIFLASDMSTYLTGQIIGIDGSLII